MFVLKSHFMFDCLVRVDTAFVDCSVSESHTMTYKGCFLHRKAFEILQLLRKETAFYKNFQSKCSEFVFTVPLLSVMYSQTVLHHSSLYRPSV